MMLAQALQMRSLLIILDGIDQASAQRDKVAQFAREALADEGFRIVCTSRPEATRLADFGERSLIRTIP